MKKSSFVHNASGSIAAKKAVSAVLAATLAVSSLGVPALAVATGTDRAFADEAAASIEQPADDAIADPAESSAAAEASDGSTNATEAADSGASTPRPGGVINATVALDTSGDPLPITEEMLAEVTEEQSAWEDTTPEWNWPLTDLGYVAWDGTVVPNAARKGIDVSEHQGWIDWDLVKEQGIDFAIIRCGYGTDKTSQDDIHWLRNVAECERLGIPYGVYLYSYAESVDAAASEAAHALRLLEGHNPDLPVYLDLEDRVQSQNLGVRAILPIIANTFCETIREAGYKPGIYANTYWWTHYLTNPVFDNWEKWVAQYNTECTYTGTYKVWQASSKMRIDGTTSKYVDVNFDLGGRFRDVDYASAYATDGSLDYVTASGLMGPVGGAFDFMPGEVVTRAQAVDLLYSMAGRPEVGFSGVGNPTTNMLPFDDVAIDSPYSSAIRWARAIGMIGNTNGTRNYANVFNPDTPVTREEMCSLLQAYMQNANRETLYNPVSLITITDGFSVSPKAIDAVSWAVGNGVLPLETTPEGLRMVNPQGEVNRADMAQLLFNTYKLFQL